VCKEGSHCPQGVGLEVKNLSMFFNRKEFSMTTNKFMLEFAKILEKISETQTQNIHKAAAWIAEAIMDDHIVFMFGSGHSAIPTFEVFPRLGLSRAGFQSMSWRLPMFQA
jgi:hypothetical protein